MTPKPSHQKPRSLLKRFTPKHRDNLLLLADDARVQFPAALGVMRIGETAKPDSYWVVRASVPEVITNGWQRSVTVICAPAHACEFLAALQAGVPSAECPNYWLRIWEAMPTPTPEWNNALEEAAQLIELASLGVLGDELIGCFSSKSGCAALLADAIRGKKRVTD